MSDQGIEVLLTPGDRELTPGDWEWPGELRSLYQRLRQQDIELEERRVSGTGHKGTATEVVIALSSSGAVVAALNVLQGWLNQRSTRTMTLTVSRGGAPVVYDLRGTGVNSEDLREVLVAAQEQTAGPGAGEP